jgi:uncharacterized protein
MGRPCIRQWRRWTGRSHVPNERVTIADRHDRRRYEIELDGELVGMLTYKLDAAAGVITHRHTEIDPASGGQGLGSQLVRFALDDARARGFAVRPLCPFVAAFIDRHPEYSDLVKR